MDSKRPLPMKENLHQKHRERLRARYHETRLAGFADHEALELLITFAIPRGDVNPIAHRLLERFGSLEQVLQAEPGELSKVPGVGGKTALLLSLCGNIHHRVELQKKAKTPTPVLRNACEAGSYALALCRGQRYECGYVVSLDKNRRVLNTSRAFQGTMAETPIYPRHVVEIALQHRAYSVLLVHNHPSGDPRPSKQDAAVTEAVQQALSCIGIQLFDHIIAGDEMAYSFTRKGLMLYTPDGVQTYGPDEIRIWGHRAVPTDLKQTSPLAAEKPE